MYNRCVSVTIISTKKASPENLITLPYNLLYQINRDYAVKIKGGELELEVICQPNDTENVLELPPKIIETLGLFTGKSVNMFIMNNKIFLGPLIGIFISNGQVKRADAQNPNFRFIETAKANKEANTVVYYFTIKDVDFTQRRITGTYFNYETEKWEKKSFPYPDVLYDRGGGTLQSQQSISNYIREELGESKRLRQFNPKYLFDKWDVYRKMLRYEEMGMYLPHTVLFTKDEDLLSMFERYHTVYMKDTAGNNGKGVARIIKQSDKDYEISHFSGNTFKYNVGSLEELFGKIKEIFDGDKKLIIQSAIDVLQINNRNADMRATVQRNGSGELSITALPVRLGKEGCPITTTRSGATVYKFEDFFQKHYNFSDEQIKRLRERVSYFLMRCFLIIEDIYGPFGEIGIDYAIDKDFRIWFIECNAKPGKDTLYLSYDDATIKRAFLNPLEYSKYLWSNFYPYSMEFLNSI